MVKLYTGQGIGGGEIGHTYIPDLWADSPGVPVKLEDRCSGWSIERRLEDGGYNYRTVAALSDAAEAGDETAIAEMDRVAKGIAVGLANVIALIQPERIAIGGGVGKLGEALLSRVRAQLDPIVFGPCVGRYELCSCVLEDAVVPTGALLLAGELL